MSGYDLVIVGGGNMGGALAAGLSKAGSAGSLAVVEVDADRREALQAEHPTIDVLGAIPSAAEAAVVAVKPGGVRDVAAELARAGVARLLSIAAGVTTATIDDAVAGRCAVVRAMPNTPALVGRGAAAITGGATATEDDLRWAESILGAVGTVHRLPETQFDAFTGLAGSGPAYLFLVAEALVDGGVAAGLPRQLAVEVVNQLVLGSAELLASRGDAAALRAMVTSPGGTTAAGLGALEHAAVRAAFGDAIAAAAARSRELR